MNNYTVHITPAASDALAQIFEYIAYELLAPDDAVAQFNHLESSIQSLSTMPKRCKTFSKTLYPGKELRRLLVDNYSIFYYINENQIIITDILYSRTDILKRLKQL